MIVRLSYILHPDKLIASIKAIRNASSNGQWGKLSLQEAKGIVDRLVQANKDNIPQTETFSTSLRMDDIRIKELGNWFFVECAKDPADEKMPREEFVNTLMMFNPNLKVSELLEVLIDYPDTLFEILVEGESNG